MENELKPCPFCGGIEKVKCTLFMSVFQVQCFECKSSAYGSNNKDQAVTAWNTRPASPVEGLETVLERPYLGSLVTRSQAEAIIAAKDAEIERWHKKAMDAGVIVHSDGTTSHPMRKERDDLEADNAALTARVKELSDLIDGENCADPDKIDALFRRAETTETQLVAARKALEDMIDGYQEYDFVDSKPVLRTIENQSSWIQRARAVLGGKTSC